jgi:hypothetical protein
MQNAECSLPAAGREFRKKMAYARPPKADKSLTRARNQYLVLPVPPLLKSTQIVSEIKIIKK